MACETVNVMETDELKKTPQRLCSEIQLFDLCSLDKCSFRDGRFCADTRLLKKFEAIADEEDERPVASHNMSTDDDADEEEWRDEPVDDEDDEDGYSVFDAEDGEEQDGY